MTHRLSIVIPVLNEATNIQAALGRLQDLRRRGHEVIVVDGGSSDQTPALAAGLADRVLNGQCGRALQMNDGAAASNREILLFLHADTELPPDCDRLIAQAMGDEPGWGRFDVRLSGSHPLFQIIAACINLRSRMSGIATGDQAMFVSSGLFEQAGGFPAIALMEDVALSRRLRSYRRPHCLPAKAVTSSRRWERHGILRTVILMWWLRFRYFLGADPDKLARLYRQP